jgi:hypothetical protein
MWMNRIKKIIMKCFFFEYLPEMRMLSFGNLVIWCF